MRTLLHATYSQAQKGTRSAVEEALSAFGTLCSVRIPVDG
ncbi:MAG: hypothetical protein ACON3Z_15885 [Bradymonadia bacterium]